MLERICRVRFTTTTSQAGIHSAEFERIRQACTHHRLSMLCRSGAHDEVTLRDNMNAYNRLVLRPRCLVDVSKIDSQWHSAY